MPENRPAIVEAAFSEREFYRREFQGRTLAVALGSEADSDIGRVAPVLEDLTRGGARVVVISPDASDLEGWLGEPPLCSGQPSLEGAVWRAVSAAGRAGIHAPGERFGPHCRAVALRLGVFKLVWLDAGGGLRDASGRRLAFVHLDELGGLLAEGGAGLATTERMPLWRDVVAGVEAGIPSINVCAPDSLDEELFTYAGSGTLFTSQRYISVRLLGVDDYDAASDLIARGTREGYLASRSPEEIDRVLAGSFGAFVENRHLAGIGTLLPGGDGRSGEIASLYTLTRFLGEGVGVSLVAFALERARALGHECVFACTTQPAVGAFFERNGLGEVSQDEIPASKWADYDPTRRAKVHCYRRTL